MSRAHRSTVEARHNECWLPVEPLLGFLTEPEAPQLVEVDRAPDGIFATVSPFEDEGFRGELELADIGVAARLAPLERRMKSSCCNDGFVPALRREGER